MSTEIDAIATAIFNMMIDSKEPFDKQQPSCKAFYRKIARWHLQRSDKLCTVGICTRQLPADIADMLTSLFEAHEEKDLTNWFDHHWKHLNEVVTDLRRAPPTVKVDSSPLNLAEAKASLAAIHFHSKRLCASLAKKKDSDEAIAWSIIRECEDRIPELQKL